MTVTATCGSLLLTPGMTVAEALGLADEHLYSRKHRRAGGSAHQAATALAQVLLEQSPDTAEHTMRVAEIAGDIARAMGLDHEAVGDVRLTAMLHDIGKVAIPRSILDKRDPLDAAERAFIQRHTLIGERIVAAAPSLKHISRAVRSSHERWDGGGYPDGLSAGETPLPARVSFVADAYTAMTEDRPYRRARSAAEALAELEACAGTQFDPDVVAAAFVVLDDAGSAGAQLAGAATSPS
jgi:putative nucleotidyltransferase with HDIG domain